MPSEFIQRCFPPEIPGFVTSACGALGVTGRAGTRKRRRPHNGASVSRKSSGEGRGGAGNAPASPLRPATATATGIVPLRRFSVLRWRRMRARHVDAHPALLACAAPE